MKVWELLEKLKDCHGDMEVWISAGNYNAVPAEEFHGDDGESVTIHSSVCAEPESDAG